MITDALVPYKRRTCMNKFQLIFINTLRDKYQGIVCCTNRYILFQFVFHAVRCSTCLQIKVVHCITIHRYMCSVLYNVEQVNIVLVQVN